MARFGPCSRCGKWAVEHLRTHSFCWECDYSPETDITLRPWTALEFRQSRIAARRREEENRVYSGGSTGFAKNEPEVKR